MAFAIYIARKSQAVVQEVLLFGGDCILTLYLQIVLMIIILIFFKTMQKKAQTPLRPLLNPY